MEQSSGKQRAPMDLVIRNARIFTDGLEIDGDLGVREGRVACHAGPGVLDAPEVIDADGKVVFPGLVDIGINPLRENDYFRNSGETLATLSRQALLGGVTTLIYAAEFDPRGDFTAQTDARRADDERGAWTDFGWHYFVPDWSEERRRHLVSAIGSGLSSVWIARTDTLADHPGITLIHSVVRELPDSVMTFVTLGEPVIEEYFRNQNRNEGLNSFAALNSLYPPAVEASTLRMCAAMLEDLRGRITYVGLSSREAVIELQRLREKGYNVHGGVNLSSLAFYTEALSEETQNPDRQTIPVVWPPVRARTQQQGLWTALDNAMFSFVTSGHHPITKQEAADSLQNALDAPQGASGLGHLLPILYSEGVARWRLEGTALSMAACADPAKLAGLYPRKGSLQVGSDADFVIVDPAKEFPLRRTTPGDRYDTYEARECACTVEAVYLRGKAVAGEGSVTGDPGGRLVSRRLALE